MRAPFIVAATGAALLVAATARGEPALAAALQVDEGLCFDRATLAAKVQQWARSPIDPGIRVHVTQQGHSVSFVLLRGSAIAGQRTLALPEVACGDTTDAVALAIALALDASAPEGTAEAPHHERVAPERRLPDGGPAGEDRAALGRRAVPTVSLSATGFAAVGVLAHASPGVAAAVDVRWTPTFETHLAVFTVAETGSSPYSSGGSGSGLVVRDTLVGGSVDGCVGATSGWSRLRACAGGALGVILSNVTDLSGAEPRAVPMAGVGWAGPTVRLEACIPVTDSLALSASVDGFAPWARPEPAVHGPGQPTSLPPVPVFGVGAGGGLMFDL